MNKKFSIDGDLLGIVAYIIRKSGPHVGQDGSIHMLREIHDQLQPKHVEDHLVHLALDCLGYKKQLVLCAWIAGKISLTPTFERELRDNGWLYGVKPKLPEKVIERLEFYNKHVYNGCYGEPAWIGSHESRKNTSRNSRRKRY